DRLVDRERTFAREAGAKRLAIHERHHVVEKAVHLARVVQRQDVRMVHLRDDVDLAREAVDAHRRAQLGAQHLERDLAVVLDVAGQIDDGHAALTDLALDLVPAAQRGGEFFIGRHAGKLRVRSPARERGGRGPEAEARKPDESGVPCSGSRLPVSGYFSLSCTAFPAARCATKFGATLFSRSLSSAFFVAGRSCFVTASITAW